MALHRGYRSDETTTKTGVTLPSGQDADAESVNLGLEFYVTQAGCTLTHIAYYNPANDRTSTLFTREMAVYSTVDGATGTLLFGPVTVDPTAFSVWVVHALATPLALTANTRYRVVTRHSAGKYGAIGGYFDTGPGSTDQVTGPLTIPARANAAGTDQGSYTYAATLAFPVNQFGGANYWNDITVDDGASTTPSASGTDSWSFAGSGVGKRTPKGSGTDSWNFAGSGTGKKTSNASGTDSWNFAGSGVGKRVAKASGTDSWDFAGSGAGKRIAKATGTDSWNFAGSGIGSAPSTIPKGSGIDSWNFAGAGVGKRVPVASGVDSWNFAGSGVGAVPSTAGTSTGGSIIIIGNKVGFIF